jgi:hypothetical protein
MPNDQQTLLPVRLPRPVRPSLAKLMPELEDIRNGQGNEPIITQVMAARALGVSRPRIQQLADKGALAVVDIGGKRVVTLASVVAYGSKPRNKGGGQWHKKNTVKR